MAEPQDKEALKVALDKGLTPEQRKQRIDSIYATPAERARSGAATNSAMLAAKDAQNMGALSESDINSLRSTFEQMQRGEDVPNNPYGDPQATEPAKDQGSASATSPAPTSTETARTQQQPALAASSGDGPKTREEAVEYLDRLQRSTEPLSADRKARLDEAFGVRSSADDVARAQSDIGPRTEAIDSTLNPEEAAAIRKALSLPDQAAAVPVLSQEQAQKLGAVSEEKMRADQQQAMQQAEEQRARAQANPAAAEAGQTAGVNARQFLDDFTKGATAGTLSVAKLRRLQEVLLSPDE